MTELDEIPRRESERDLKSEEGFFLEEESGDSSDQAPKLRRSTRQAAKNTKPHGMGENEAIGGSSDDSDFEDPRLAKGGSPGRKSLQSMEI